MSSITQEVLTAAIRAPSGDNCQPWWFECETADRIWIGIKPERAKSFFDFGYCGTYLSVGAVIENIQIQANAVGYRTDVELLSGDHTAGDPVASVQLVPAMDDQPESAKSLRTALFERTVNRRPFLPWPPSKTIMDSLLADPVPGVSVRIMGQRSEVRRWARVIYLADQVRYSHPVIHEELFSKLLYEEDVLSGKRIGLEVARLGIGPGAASIMRLLSRWERVQRLSRWGLTAFLAGQSRMLALTSGAMVLVIIGTDAVGSWIRAGQQVQRLWVRAQASNLCVHPMTVSLYLDLRYQKEGLGNFLPHHEPLLRQIREELKTAINSNIGAMLFRVGYAWPMRSVAVRLPLDQFMRA